MQFQCKYKLQPLCACFEVKKSLGYETYSRKKIFRIYEINLVLVILITEACIFFLNLTFLTRYISHTFTCSQLA